MENNGKISISRMSYPKKNPATIKHKIDNGMAFDISLLIMLRYDF